MLRNQKCWILVHLTEKTHLTKMSEDKEIKLGPTEFNLLRFFLENNNFNQKIFGDLYQHNSKVGLFFFKKYIKL